MLKTKTAWFGISLSMTTVLCNIIVGCTRPQSMLLAMLTPLEELHVFHLVAIWVTQAPLLTAEYPAIPKHFLKQWLCGYVR